MENASKALIIAGAILISILLISVGIIVMNAINDPVSQAGDSASSQAIEIFNSKFTGYAGKQKGTTVKQLITAINSSNGADKSHQISFDNAEGCVTTIGGVDPKKEYTVDFTFASGAAGETNTAAGYICKVSIK